jgi:hypothetical protein
VQWSVGPPARTQAAALHVAEPGPGCSANRTCRTPPGWRGRLGEGHQPRPGCEPRWRHQIVRLPHACWTNERPTIALEMTLWSRVDVVNTMPIARKLRRRSKSRPARSRRVTGRPRKHVSCKGRGVGIKTRLLLRYLRRSEACRSGGGGNRTRPNDRNPSDPDGCEHNPSGSVGTDRVPTGPAVDAVNTHEPRHHDEGR